MIEAKSPENEIIPDGENIINSPINRKDAVNEIIEEKSEIIGSQIDANEIGGDILKFNIDDVEEQTYKTQGKFKKFVNKLQFWKRK